MSPREPVAWTGDPLMSAELRAQLIAAFPHASPDALRARGVDGPGPVTERPTGDEPEALDPRDTRRLTQEQRRDYPGLDADIVAVLDCREWDVEAVVGLLQELQRARDLDASGALKLATERRAYADGMVDRLIVRWDAVMDERDARLAELTEQRDQAQAALAEMTRWRDGAVQEAAERQQPTRSALCIRARARLHRGTRGQSHGRRVHE